MFFGLSPLLAADVLDRAQVAQEMVRKDLVSSVIVAEGAAILGLVFWLMRTLRQLNAVQEKRIVDRDRFQEKLDTLSRDTALVVKENSTAMLTLLRAVESLREFVRPKARPPKPPEEP